jgi:hypothetical protein
LGVGLALVAGAFLLTDVLLWRPGVTERNVRRIRPGLTLKEVEGLLGRHNGGTVIMGGLAPILTWEGERGNACVQFSVAGRAEGATFLPFQTPQAESPLARLRTWLGW